MGFFKALGKLGKAAVGTALLPVDMARELIPDDEDFGDKTSRRVKKIGSNLEDFLEEVDEDDD